MKQQPQLSSMIKGQVFDGYLLIRSAVQKTASSGSKYLDMTVCDISGECNAKMWDGTVLPPEANSVMRIRGSMQEFNNRMQFRVDRMRETTDADEFDMQALIPTAPQKGSVMYEEIKSRIEKIADEKLRQLVTARLESYGDKVEYYPAATRLHHAEQSGLLHHTSTMLRAAEAMCSIYPELDSDLLAAGVILHDLCKITEIEADEIGLPIDYSTEGMLIGHLVQGVAELNRIGREIGVDQELLLMLEHMILSHHDLPEYGSPKPPMFPEAEMLHTLDLVDARMFEMNRALSAVEPGHFTERLWSLDRKLYRRKSKT